jgi:deaminated glutathione amidase
VRATIGQLAASQDPEGNRRAASQAIMRAGQGESDLLVLPEATQCGFGSPGTDLSGLAEPLDGPFVETLHGAAARTGVTVIAGMFELLRPEEAFPSSSSPHVDGAPRVYNTVVVVDHGGLVARYRKLHLYDALGFRESSQVRAGDAGASATAVVPVAEHRVGVMTCYDVRFPELSRLLADDGATVLAVMAAWQPGPGKEEQWRVLLQARAIENTCYVLGSAQPAPDFTGRSMVVDPRGHVVAALDAGSQELLTADLSIDEVHKVRQVLPLLESRRFRVAPSE